MPYIKNIEQGKVLPLKDEIQVQKGQVVSKTLAQNDAVSVTLFAFSKGEEISTHQSVGDAMVYEHLVSAGETIVMPANVPHAVYGEEDFKWLLTVVFPFE